MWSLPAALFFLDSFRDEADQSFQADIFLLAAGIVIIILYVAVVMGKFNEVEHKVSKDLSIIGSDSSNFILHFI